MASLLSFLETRDIQKAILFLPTCACVDYWSHIFPSLIPKKLNLPIFAIHGKMKYKRNQVLESFRKAKKGIILCTDVMARGIDIPEVRLLHSTLYSPKFCSSDVCQNIFGTNNNNEDLSEEIICLWREIWISMPIWSFSGNVTLIVHFYSLVFIEKLIFLLFCLQIDWVLQWDPPKDANAFVHRIGRTARQGNEGSSLLLLYNSEEDYVKFIEKNQRVFLTRLEDDISDEMVSYLSTVNIVLINLMNIQIFFYK